MNNLTKEQIDFLNKHNISLDEVYDAEGMSPSEYKVEMKKLGKKVAYNVNPCYAGHTLRTRSGHCVQCNPARLEFQTRNDSSGIVYIAGTRKGQIIKIGYSKKVEIRQESLNRTVYAGYNDWQILFAIKSSFAGKIENEISEIMKPYLNKNPYKHDGHLQQAQETYKCSYTKAKNNLINLCNTNGSNYTIAINKRTDKYNFQNLRKIN